MACRKLAETLEAFDGLELYCETYASPSPKGVIIALHDFGEHGGVYAATFERLAAAGLTTYALDLRGHGKSPGDRAFIADFDDYLDDLDLVLARVRDREAERAGNIFLLGRGLGATIAARFAFTRRPRLRGLILCAPLLDLPLSSLERRLVRYTGRLFPRATWVAASARLGPKPEGDLQGDSLSFSATLPLHTVKEILDVSRELCGVTHHIPFPLLTLVAQGQEPAAAQRSEELHDAVLTVDKSLLRYEISDADTLLHRPSDRAVADLCEWCERLCDDTEGAVVIDDDDEDEDDSL